MGFADDADLAAWQGEIMERVGRRVRAAREAAGVSQAELARRVEFTRATIANIEAGRQDTTMTRLALIAAALGEDLSGLIRDGATAPVPHNVSVQIRYRVWCETCGEEVDLTAERATANGARRSHITQARATEARAS